MKEKRNRAEETEFGRMGAERERGERNGENENENPPTETGIT